jgi:hypothetical protein
MQAIIVLMIASILIVMHFQIAYQRYICFVHIIRIAKALYRRLFLTPIDDCKI